MRARPMGEAPGLGLRFRQAVDAMVDRMRANPLQFPIILKNVRRALCGAPLIAAFRHRR